MRLQSFQARTVGAAMQQIRVALGNDAIILATQESADGVQITAAVEDGDDLQHLLDVNAPPALRAALEACLQHHRLPARLRDELLADAVATPAADPAAALMQALGTRFRFVPIALPLSRPIAVVGPPGSGKSAAIARLAAQALVGGHPAAVFSTDTRRAGGLAQLTALLEPLRLKPVAASDTAGMARSVAAASGENTVLIDTGGVNPFRGQELAAVADLLRLTGAEPVLVLPAGLESADSIESVGNFAAIGVRRMIVTRLDTARRLGSVLAVADIGLAFAGVSVGPRIGTGTTALTAAGLARVMLHLAAAPNTQLQA